MLRCIKPGCALYGQARISTRYNFRIPMKLNWNKPSKTSLQAGFFLLLLVFLAPAWGVPGSTHSAAIASAHPLATEAGEKILRQGGNAFDAAVAVSAALAVVEPYSSGLGGGGLWLLHRARDRREVLIDGRETAPGKASVGMYLNGKGEPIAAASLNGPWPQRFPECRLRWFTLRRIMADCRWRIVWRLQ